MTILEQIKKPWAIGWSAELKDECGSLFIVVGVFKKRLLVREVVPSSTVNANFVHDWDNRLLDDLKITGYLHAGQLAGNEPIPEGQRFRVKESGEIRRAS